MSSVRTKHVDIKKRHVREISEKQIFHIEPVSTIPQVADLLTKQQFFVVLHQFVTSVILCSFELVSHH